MSVSLLIYHSLKGLHTHLFEILDEVCSFNTILYVKADVHFYLCVQVCQFNDGDLQTHRVLNTSRDVWQTSKTAKPCV